LHDEFFNEVKKIRMQIRQRESTRKMPAESNGILLARGFEVGV
jgi:hypothetical protein